MAKRRNKKKQIVRKRQQQKTNRPANRLQEAMASLQNGDYHSAITHGASAYEAQNDEETQDSAGQLLTEAYFRVAAKTTNMETRLRHLDRALKYTPDDSRSHLHRGNTLVGMGNVEAALEAFQQVDPATLKQVNMNYPIQLARMAAGEKWFATGLSSTEANTLYLLESILQDGTDEEMAQCIEQMEKDDPQTAETAIWKVFTQIYQKPKSAPITRLQNAVSEDNTDPILCYYLGVLSMRKGEMEAAKTYWEQAAENGLESQWLTKNQALLLSEEAQKSASVGAWRQITTTTYPPSLLSNKALGELVAIAHDHLGYEAAQQNQWDKAGRHWRKASATLQNRHLVQNLALSAEKTGNWPLAAESWRGVARRRPRKKTHPDYLTDMQVAAIWRHAADCHNEENDIYEMLHCLNNALKYAPDDIDIRMKLAQNYLRDHREDQAKNELDKILNIDPDNIPALELLGTIYSVVRMEDDMEIWQRILKIDPSHLDARQALAESYITKSHQRGMRSRSDFMGGLFARMKKSEKSRVRWLEEGLEELPGHPKLLLELGLAYSEIEKKEKALDYLHQAKNAAPNDLDIVEGVMVGLMGIKEDELLQEMQTELREQPKITAMFWLRLTNETLERELGEEWALHCGREAIAYAKERPKQYSIAFILSQLAEMAHRRGLDEIGEIYEKQIEAEVPKSGAKEFVTAFKAYHNDDDMTKARRMLQRAKTKAKKAQETDILEHVEKIETLLFSAPFNILRMLEEGNIPPDFL